MSVSDLKLDLIARISRIDDREVLAAIDRLVSFQEKVEETYPLSEAERLAIQEGLRDVQEGRTYTPEAAEHMIQEWLKRK
ncbi:MAG: hypothetical protein ACK5DD_07200 [Cyclobacteriaceae bacterium]|jgi:predicted transcriptional regulator